MKLFQLLWVHVHSVFPVDQREDEGIQGFVIVLSRNTPTGDNKVSFASSLFVFCCQVVGLGGCTMNLGKLRKYLGLIVLKLLEVLLVICHTSLQVIDLLFIGGDRVHGF